MLESHGQSANTTWEDYASGLARLGGDRPSLEAMRRTGMIAPNGSGGFSLTKAGMPSGADPAKPAAPSSAKPASAPTAAGGEHPYRPGLKAHGAEWAAERKKLWRQSTTSDLDTLIAQSPANQAALAEVCAAAAKDIGLKWKDPGVKKTERIKDKLARGKTVQEVNDAVRGGFDTPTPEQSDKVVRTLARHFEVADEGWTVTPQGYFDRKVMVRFKDGQIGEVQMWAPGMLDAKEGEGGGHKLYEAWQNSKDPQEKAELTDKMNALYKGVQDKLDKSWHSIFRPNVP